EPRALHASLLEHQLRRAHHGRVACQRRHPVVRSEIRTSHHSNGPTPNAKRAGGRNLVGRRTPAGACQITFRSERLWRRLSYSTPEGKEKESYSPVLQSQHRASQRFTSASKRPNGSAK